MTLVVDASVALKWFVDEPDSDHAVALLESGEPLVAPELVIAESLNAAWRLVRYGAFGETVRQRILDELPTFYDRFWGLLDLAASASAIARDLDHPVYDCFYLALAEKAQATLVTADARLLKRVPRTRWAKQVAKL